MEEKLILKSNEDFVPGRFNPLLDEITEAIHKSLYEISNDWKDLNVDQNKERFSKDLKNLQKRLSLLSLPPRFTTLRVNLQKVTLEDALCAIESNLNDQYEHRLKNKPDLVICKHRFIPDLIAVQSQNAEKVIPATKEVIVGRLCGSAVLRGADVFAPGVLGCATNIKEGDEVSVYADLEDKCLRGSKSYKGKKMFLGNGAAVQGRRDLFRSTKPSGVAITMTEKVFDCPSIGDFGSDVFFLQNLPSILCSHILGPAEGAVVLDMCAAPGGKTTHLASLVGDRGRVIAIDRSQKKIANIKQNAEKWGLANISAYAFDSTKLVISGHESGSKNIMLLDHFENVTPNDVNKRMKLSDYICTGVNNARVDAPPYAPSSFKWILLDAPCSALGQRPQIQSKMSLKELWSFLVIQRKLLENAVALLQPGGVLVYSTCTIIAEENEKMVKWLLDNFKNMELVNSNPKIGTPGLSNCGLDYNQCHLVQRFGPKMSVTDDCDIEPSELETDTIGFFIAKFTKMK